MNDETPEHLLRWTPKRLLAAHVQKAVDPLLWASIAEGW
jgi:hypothetical protein